MSHDVTFTNADHYHEFITHEADRTCDGQLLVAGVRLRMHVKRLKKKAQTFLIDAELKKVASRTNVTCVDTNDSNTMW